MDGVVVELQEDPRRGDRIKKAQWPSCYKKRYGVKNLYRLELQGARRLIYSLEMPGGRELCMILEVMTHKDYERRFAF